MFPTSHPRITLTVFQSKRWDTASQPHEPPKEQMPACGRRRRTPVSARFSSGSQRTCTAGASGRPSLGIGRWNELYARRHVAVGLAIHLPQLASPPTRAPPQLERQIDDDSRPSVYNHSKSTWTTTTHCGSLHVWPFFWAWCSTAGTQIL